MYYTLPQSVTGRDPRRTQNDPVFRLDALVPRFGQAVNRSLARFGSQHALLVNSGCTVTLPGGGENGWRSARRAVAYTNTRTEYCLPVDNKREMYYLPAVRAQLLNCFFIYDLVELYACTPHYLTHTTSAARPNP